MKQIALITGASSGIGKSLSEIFAKDGINLVLVARSFDKLKDQKEYLEKKYSIKVDILEKDLSLINSPKEVYEFTQSNKIKINYLINNAGFGDYGPFIESDNERNIQMLNLNITALTSLTRYYLEDMKKDNFGKILNIASTAGFQPGPYMAVYFASKAYVKNFGLALANELEKTNITVTTLCPGPTESSFGKNANANETALFSGKLPSSDIVAKFGYKSMMKGKKLVIHGFMNRVKSFIIKFLPTNLMLRIMNFIIKR